MNRGKLTWEWIPWQHQKWVNIVRDKKNHYWIYKSPTITIFLHTSSYMCIKIQPFPKHFYWKKSSSTFFSSILTHLMLLVFFITLENIKKQRFSDVFRECGKTPVEWNWISQKCYENSIITLIYSFNISQSGITQIVIIPLYVLNENSWKYFPWIWLSFSSFLLENWHICNWLITICKKDHKQKLRISFDQYLPFSHADLIFNFSVLNFVF